MWTQDKEFSTEIKSFVDLAMRFQFISNSNYTKSSQPSSTQHFQCVRNKGFIKSHSSTTFIIIMVIYISLSHVN